MNRISRLYPTILDNPVDNARLYREIENFADDLFWMEDDYAYRRMRAVKEKASSLTHKYGAILNPKLAEMIEHYIWEEYHNIEPTTASSKKAYEDDDDNVVQCPACGAEYEKGVMLLGGLGNREHYRCRDCGYQWSEMKRRASMNKTTLASQLVKIAKELVAMPVFEKAPGFDDKFKEFLAYCQTISDEYISKNYTNVQKPQFIAMEGGRYIRVVRTDSSSRSAHLFVDKTNGDVLKAAGWSAPAKGQRGNIFDKASWQRTGPYGAAYLK